MDTLLYRRFFLVALFIAALGVAVSLLIQETRAPFRAGAAAAVLLNG